MLVHRFLHAKDSVGNGAGLGHAIVGATMKTHGGEVVVEDAPGGGALFTLLFRRPAEAPQP